MRRAWVLLVVLCACGIKAPPRPPLDAPTTSTPAAAPDAGCCREKSP